MNDDDRRPSVLIVNDNSDKAYLFQERFQAQLPGVDVDVATDARFAKQLIERCAPDVLVLDATIPDSLFNQRITSGDYTNSLSVAQAYASQCPNGKIILLSSYAPHISGRYPNGTIPLHEEKFDGVPTIIRNHLGMAGQEPTALIEKKGAESEAAVKHISRIQAVRRSNAHNGSREGDQECWSEQVGKMNVEDEVKRKERSARTV